VTSAIASGCLPAQMPALPACADLTLNDDDLIRLDAASKP
jgi:hypothetical protein